ncbi:MAG: tetratricopeptide repeat protein [Tsuneonella suprasediminis]
MMYLSFPAGNGQASPAVVVDRLRGAWITTGVYLILEGVTLQMGRLGDSPAEEGQQERHFLVAFDGDVDEVPELLEMLRAEDLPGPTLWSEANVIETVGQAADYYQSVDLSDAGAAIYQRLSQALPRSPTALSNAGRWFLRAGRLFEANGYLEAAVSVGPGIPEILINLHVLRLLQGDGDAAAEIFAKLVSDHSDHPVVQMLIAEKPP